MSVETHRAELVDQSLPGPKVPRPLPPAHSIGGVDAVAALLNALTDDPSALFRHEVAFALGQMQAPGAVDVLKRGAEHYATDDEMVDFDYTGVGSHRHGGVRGRAEGRLRRRLPGRARDGDACAAAARARAKRGEAKDAVEAPASKTLGSAKERLSAPGAAAPRPRTVRRATASAPIPRTSPSIRSRRRPRPFHPTPSPPSSLNRIRGHVGQVRRHVRAAQRGDGPGVARTLGEVLGSSQSALLKHEACYVLGQLQEADATARASLVRTLEDVREHPMVRHEAAEAIGSIAAPDTENLLRKYAGDGDRIVARSCEVALDIMASEMSGEFVPLAACGGGRVREGGR